MEKAMAKLKLVAAKKEEAAEPHFSALKSNSKPVMVPVSKLLIDERYQYNPQTEDGRLAKLNKWLAMSGGYDPAKAGVIHVSERKNGDLYVVDGYGRVWMGSRLVDNPIKEIPAIIHNDLQQWEDEAKLFVELNKNKRIIKKSHLFVVAANAGHEPEASILKIVRSYGYAVERMVHRNGAIIAPGALIFAHKLGHEVLERSLNILRSSWGDNHVVGNHVTTDAEQPCDKLSCSSKHSHVSCSTYAHRNVAVSSNNSHVGVTRVDVGHAGDHTS